MLAAVSCSLTFVVPFCPVSFLNILKEGECWEDSVISGTEALHVHEILSMTI